MDGGYFVRRIEFFHRKYFKSHTLTAEHMTAILLYLVNRHQKSLHRNELYRIFYYDAPPFEGQLRFPVSDPDLVGGPRTKNFKRDERVIRQQEFHTILNTTRKVAIRMGELATSKNWLLNADAQEQLLKSEKQVSDLLPNDFHVDIQQKGVDTRLGIDIANLTFHKFVDTIVLVASDADFAPAAKLARIYGVDVVLDPLFGNVAKSLESHIDGKKSYDMVRKLSKLLNAKPQPEPKWWADS